MFLKKGEGGSAGTSAYINKAIVFLQQAWVRIQVGLIQMRLFAA